MTTHKARLDARAIAQVTTLTPVAANNTAYEVTVNGRSPGSITSDGSADVQEIVEALQSVLAASTLADIDAIDWIEDNTKITATGANTGEPFIVENAGAGTINISTTTVSQSQNHWVAANFDTLTLPGNGDTVYVQGTGRSILYGLDQNAVTLTLLEFFADFTGYVGLPEFKSNGDYEARDTHLKISATTLRIGDGSGQGSGRLKINTGTNACAAIVYKTGQPADTDEAAVHLVGSHGSNTLEVYGGTVDVAMLPGYAAEWPTITATGGAVRLGTGCTNTTITVSGTGSVECRSAATTVSVADQGKYLHIGSGNITTLSHYGASCEVRATGALTIGTLNLGPGKTLDLSKSKAAVTITNCTAYGTDQSPAVINDPGNRLTMTNAASTPNGAHTLKIVTGRGKNLRVT